MVTNSLSNLKNSIDSTSKKSQRNVTFEETYDIVSRLIETDGVAKIQETEKNTSAEKIKKKGNHV